jgi:DNA topoisomerase-1
MRTVACQMTDASGYRATLDTRVDTAIFRSKGKVYTFPGYRRAYVEGADNPEEKLKEKETELPSLSEGSEVETLEVELREHATQPPSRLTEASLIKEMEARGIGRPSTYASIIGTIQNRGYVFKKSGALVPTWTAIAVIRLLESHFGKLIDYDFTANLENGLDAIARGESDSLAYLTNFYRGSTEKGSEHKGLMQLLADAVDQADPRKICSISIGEVDGVPLLARVGRYGPYLEHSDQRGRLPDDMPPDELNVEKALEILHAEAEGPLVLGSDPESGQEVTLRTGRFGPYVQLGEIPEGKKTPKPKRASLLKGMSEDSIDLETACLLLSLPRTLGEGADGKPVMAHNGRYGPYLKCGDETRNIPAEHSVLTINLEQAQELLAQPSTRGRSKPSVIREIVGEDAAIKMMNGRWGPYVTDGKTNASLPKGTDPESVDYDAAFALLEKKRSSPRKGRKRKS